MQTMVRMAADDCGSLRTISEAMTTLWHRFHWKRCSSESGNKESISFACHGLTLIADRPIAEPIDHHWSHIRMFAIIYLKYFIGISIFGEIFFINSQTLHFWTNVCSTIASKDSFTSIDNDIQYRIAFIETKRANGEIKLVRMRSADRAKPWRLWWVKSSLYLSLASELLELLELLALTIRIMSHWWQQLLTTDRLIMR